MTKQQELQTKIKRQLRRVPQGWRHPYYRDPFGRICFLPIPYHAMPRAEKDRHYQMYETQTQGTPVSPVFQSRNDLLRWLIRNKIACIGSAHGSESDWRRIVESPDTEYEGD
jgi:hypothetical protein